MPSVLTPTADPRPARHFHIGDGLILMAAAALSLERLRGMGWWFTRFPVDLTSCWQEISRVGLWPPWDILFDGNLQAMRKDIATRLADDVLIQLLSALLVGFMVAQPLLRLRHPRPEPRQLIRQNGNGGKPKSSRNKAVRPAEIMFMTDGYTLAPRGKAG
jgi:hypothetical protein